MLSRIIFSLLSLTIALTSTAAYAQSVCPNEEIIIFGSAYGYTTAVCNKKGKECSQSPSSTIVFYQNKIDKAGCADAPNCNTCAGKLPKSDARAKGNFIYGGRQIFLDTTNGISKLEDLQFAMVQGDRSDTHYAIFEVSAIYNLKGKDPTYFACPIALQLPGDPGIPNPHSAAHKSVGGESQLIVNEDGKEKSYKIVESRGNHGVVETKLMRTLDKNPIPPAAKPAPAKPTQAKPSAAKSTQAKPSPAKPAQAKPRRPTPARRK